MPKSLPFVHKLVKNLDRIDRDSLERHLRELLDSHKTLENILHEIHEGVLVAQKNGDILFANSPALSWLGLNFSQNQKTNIKQIADSRVGEFLERNIPHLTQRLTGDFHILSPREMDVRIFLYPMEDKKEILILVLNLQTEKSKSSRKAADSSIEGLLSLAAGIAHEIGNPLNSIAIHLALLQKEIKNLPDNKKTNFEKALSVLQAETGRLDRIVRNFLKAARKPPLRFRHENLNQILKAAIEFMSPELSENNVRIQIKTDDNIPPFLMDRERLHQAFINLIKNAMQAMPKGGRLLIRTSLKDKIAAVVIKDEGQGISEKDLPHIFEAYYTTKTEGSGLGLMTVWKTVAEHAGHIEVSSQPGSGSTFTLLLPLREPKLQLTLAKGK